MGKATGASADDRFEQSVERKLDALLTKIGRPYVSRRQVKVSVLHWPDVVWFDAKLPRQLFLHRFRWGFPIIGFEIESSNSTQSIKAAINNLEALKPALGCIVIPHVVGAKKRAERIFGSYVGSTAREAIQYLAGKSSLPIVVLTDQEIDDFLTGQDIIHRRADMDKLFQQVTGPFFEQLTETLPTRNQNTNINP